MTVTRHRGPVHLAQLRLLVLNMRLCEALRWLSVKGTRHRCSLAMLNASGFWSIIHRTNVHWASIVEVTFSHLCVVLVEAPILIGQHCRHSHLQRCWWVFLLCVEYTKRVKLIEVTSISELFSLYFGPHESWRQGVWSDIEPWSRKCSHRRLIPRIEQSANLDTLCCWCD